MAASHQLRLGAFMRPVSIHTAWWRYPGAFPDANFNFEHLKRFAQTLERGRFDAFFMADHLAVLNMPMAALKRSATATSFDPLTLLPALAMVTERLGLIATASTTYNEPYHIARKFASLDHISGGRAGWNLVTSGNPHEAMNFGLDEHVEHETRYRRAREFFDVVTGLWDSWADDAFILHPPQRGLPRLAIPDFFPLQPFGLSACGGAATFAARRDLSPEGPSACPTTNSDSCTTSSTYKVAEKRTFLGRLYSRIVGICGAKGKRG